MADDDRRRHLEATYQEMIRERNAKIAAIRKRAGMSMNDLARAMGYAGQSSIQRYLNPDYGRAFRPEIALLFRNALLGKGDPPLTDEDLQVFLDWKVMEPGDASFQRHELVHNISEDISQMRRPPKISEDGRMTAALPLSEGEIVIVMPKQISADSAETARSWANHVINLCARFGALDALKGSPNKTWGKK